jgi:GT2 family glycosyltransferase
MDILPNDDDWACFLDHDAMFTTTDWYHQLHEIIDKNPSVGIFGVRTNRVANMHHLVGGIDVYNHDMEYHRTIGSILQKKHRKEIFLLKKDKTDQPGFSGVCILIKKIAWKAIGGFLADGFLSVDQNVRFSANDNNIKIAIMNGIYVYHWYRQDDPYQHAKIWFDRLAKINKETVNNNFDLTKIFLIEK